MALGDDPMKLAKRVAIRDVRTEDLIHCLHAMGMEVSVFRG
jgi:hypothetical protein